MSKAEAGTARRIQLFTGAGRRRAWTSDEKAAIVAESYAGGASVCEIARRRGLTPTQLFTWRREARKRAAHDGEPAPLSVPAVIETAASREPVARRRVCSPRRTPAVELEIDGVASGADDATIAAVIQALKAGDRADGSGPGHGRDEAGGFPQGRGRFGGPCARCNGIRSILRRGVCFSGEARRSREAGVLG
jgi:transposase